MTARYWTYKPLEALNCLVKMAPWVSKSVLVYNKCDRNVTNHEKRKLCTCVVFNFDLKLTDFYWLFMGVSGVKTLESLGKWKKATAFLQIYLLNYFTTSNYNCTRQIAINNKEFIWVTVHEYLSNNHWVTTFYFSPLEATFFKHSVYTFNQGEKQGFSLQYNKCTCIAC